MKQILPCLFLLLSSVLQAQQQKPVNVPAPILRVYESNRYNPANPNENLLGKDGIVEINGTLLLLLDRDAIRKEMQAYAGVQAADIRLVSKYKRILEQKTKTLQLLEEGLAASNGRPDYQKLNALSGLMDEFYTTLLSDPELRSMADKANKEYRQKVAAQLIDPNSYTDDMYFVEYFGQAAKTVLDRIQSAESVRFKLAGKLKFDSGLSNPVHLGDDFDEIPEENYVVPRWVFSLSEDQKEELRAVAQLSNQRDS
ncbi:MAG: hypothetical protein ACOYPR_15060, partial [Saprospiraceae bacterium]